MDMDLHSVDKTPTDQSAWAEDEQLETLAQLHYRLLRALEAATGQWAGHWLRIVGPLCHAGETWALTSLHGGPEEHVVVRSIADIVRRYRPRAI
jgi:hypothetical protein